MTEEEWLQLCVDIWEGKYGAKEQARYRRSADQWDMINRGLCIKPQRMQAPVRDGKVIYAECSEVEQS
jgi:hypothetical protein